MIRINVLRQQPPKLHRMACEPINPAKLALTAAMLCATMFVVGAQLVGLDFGGTFRLTAMNTTIVAAITYAAYK